MRRAWALVAVGLLLGGCGGDGDEGEESVEADGTTTTAAEDRDGGSIESGSAIRYRLSGTAGDEVADVLRDRIEALGIDDVEVVRDGDSLTLVLPVGVDEATELAATLGTAGRLELRPVLTSHQFITAEALADAGAAGAGAGAGTSDTLDDLVGCGLLGGATPIDDITRGATVVLPGRDDGAGEDDDHEPELCFQLGPLPTGDAGDLDGSMIEDPEAQLAGGEWGVAFDIVDDRLALFNEVAEACFVREATCPTGQLAIVLDGVVQSAPSINEPRFTGEGIQISGSFTEAEAGALAVVLRLGALDASLEVVEILEID